jgi:hypothetical protein
MFMGESEIETGKLVFDSTSSASIDKYENRHVAEPVGPMIANRARVTRYKAREL